MMLDLPEDLLKNFPFRRVAIIGAGGMLGQDLVQTLQPLSTVLPFNTQSLNLQSSEEVLSKILIAATPDLIINAAAYTNVDQAEIKPEVADDINHQGPLKLAKIASQLQIPLAHISTDYVFDGNTNTPYQPSDAPNPISIYGKTKHRGELAVQANCPKHWVIRTSWLYGGEKNHFVRYVIDNAQQKKAINIVNDWTGSPTWTANLAKMIVAIVTQQPYGIVHAADNGCLSKYQQACDIYQHLGVDTTLITPVSHRQFNFKANRPAFSALACPTIKTAPWNAAFAEYEQQLRQPSP